MHRHRLTMALVIAGLLLGGSLANTPRPAAAHAEQCFAETGFCVQGRFLDYWLANGGLARNGYPLSDERRERLVDGHEYTVQYFERVRLEHHPENPPPYDVLLGHFGRRVLRELFGYEAARYQAAIAPAQPSPGQPYFAATGHNVPPDFFAHWQAHGGLAGFGYPLTEVFAERLEDGNVYQVQYFERARFERHPEHAGTPHAVLLGQFGRTILYQTRILLLSGRFGALYIIDERARGLLGSPGTTTFQAPGTAQEFERGRMIYWREPGADGLIAVLCGDQQSGQVFTTSRLELAFPDTWDPSQPIGGGAGPGPGLHEPRAGFGKLWREHPAVRECLGYATAPDETPYTLTAQYYARGLLLATPEGQSAYALYLEAIAPGQVAARYARFVLPMR